VGRFQDQLDEQLDLPHRAGVALRLGLKFLRQSQPALRLERARVQLGPRCLQLCSLLSHLRFQFSNPRLQSRITRFQTAQAILESLESRFGLPALGFPLVSTLLEEARQLSEGTL
jgi:hypothetical protein